MDRPSHNHPLYPSHLAVKQAGYRFPYTPIQPSSSPFSTFLADLRRDPPPHCRHWLRNGSLEFVTSEAIMEDDDMVVSTPLSPDAPVLGRSISGPSAPQQTSFDPFVFGTSDFVDENVSPPVATPFVGVIRWGTPEVGEPAAAKLQSAADFEAWATRPAVDFEAPLMFHVGHGFRRLRSNERTVDDDEDDQDPEDCPTLRLRRRVSRSLDGYESEAWRRYNRRLNRLRCADKQHRKATSLASRRNASKKRKEAGDQESA
ncbi:hypothetical protein B0T18DRAFT_441571 [Schizothecium vesticola]|uniref:Uncharacterized protein n=1 Tax=Schizothecium vesticola TaxID=314040 RepID=A0AA40KBL6_9PEZI|nr:hypothetical protein B0T18DRAFT_441571 [Schizothecium vesticola]